MRCHGVRDRSGAMGCDSSVEASLKFLLQLVL